MSSIHFMNVGEGDCIFLDHNTPRQSLIDICGGNRDRRSSKYAREVRLVKTGVRGNFQMCKEPVHPLDYLDDCGVDSIWRFISSHPDMDHLDGIRTLWDDRPPSFFWTSGVVREKPDFSDDVRYREEDWDWYERLRKNNVAGTKTLTPQAGAHFYYANESKDGSGGHDGLYILSPNQQLVDEAEDSEDFNDASYLILYKSAGGRAVFPGDAHDDTWEFVVDEYRQDVQNIKLLAAPHHGRKSGRSYDFLDVLQPTLTIFGCAPSSELAYDPWRSRDLVYITANGAGCIVAECADGSMEIYVENETFAEKVVGNTDRTNSLGFYYLATI